MDDGNEKTDDGKKKEEIPVVALQGIIFPTFPFKKVFHIFYGDRIYDQFWNDRVWTKVWLKNTGLCLLFDPNNFGDIIRAIDLKTVHWQNPVYTIFSLRRGNLFPPPPDNQNLTMENSCLGVVLLVDTTNNHPVRVCNPLRSEVRALPPSFEEKINKSLIGFGVDSASKEVLKVLKSAETNNVKSFSVWTVGENDWRMIDGSYEFSIGHVHLNTVFNFRLHWVATEKTAPLVCYFDFNQEIFGDVAVPERLQSRDVDRNLIALGVLGNSISLSLSTMQYLEIWTMDQSSQGSWTEFLRVRNTFPMFRSTDGSWRRMVIPLVLANKMLVVLSHSRLYVYNSSLHELFSISIAGLPNLPRAISFTPSLLSLDHMV